VTELASLDPRFNEYADQRDDLKARLEDLAFFLRQYGAEIESSPDRLQKTEDRLAALERLKRRHGPLLSDVLARADELRAELRELGASEEQAASLPSVSAPAVTRSNVPPMCSAALVGMPPAGSLRPWSEI
jgi:DNA repair protein RecN (Recombination protein N)